jgi:hypothetical protein
MTTTVNLSLTDYMKIAALVNNGTTDEPSRFEVEYTANGITLYLDVTHDFDTHTVRGGSYEGRDFERLTEVVNEEFDIIAIECLDADGEPVTCDFTTRRLLDILN